MKITRVGVDIAKSFFNVVEQEFALLCDISSLG